MSYYVLYGKRSSIMKKFFNYTYLFIKKYRKTFLENLAFVLLLTGLQVFLPISLRFFIKEVEAKQAFSFLTLGIFAYACYLLISNFVDIGWAMSLDKLGGKIMQGIREDLFNSISKADYEDLLNIGKDKIKNILFMDTMNIFSSVAHLGIQIISDLIILIAFLIVSSYLNMKLTIILFIASIIGFLISYFSRKPITSSSRQVNAQMKADNQMLNEYIDSLELVKTNNLDKYYLRRNKNSLWEFINTSIRVDKKQIFLKNLIMHFHQLVSIGLTAFLSMTSAGDSVGNLVFYLFVSDMILQNSQGIEGSIYSLMKMLPSFEHIDKILNLKKCGGNTEIGPISTIEFHNVDFYYRSNIEKAIIENINTSFSSGDIVRISGVNGSGKSTFVKLMIRLLYPNNGQIFLNNIPLNKIDAACLKKQIIYIDQDEVILNDTIKNYVEAMAERSVSDPELYELMELVHFDSQIKKVSENGCSLSGGQRKKLLMIKLLLRYKLASVIILDEIEAGLDAETKNIILRIEHEILSQQKDCIIFKISHEATESDFYTKTIELNSPIVTCHNKRI